MFWPEVKVPLLIDISTVFLNQFFYLKGAF